MSDTLLFHRLNDFACLWYVHTKRLPKLDRYTIGQKVFELLVEMLVLVMQAQYKYAQEKLPALKNIIPLLDTVKILIRLAYKLQILEEPNYIRYESELNEIGKMLGGWIRHLENKPR